MESTIYTVAGKEFELQHYGVKGMKWGRRKKPEPYIQDLGGGVTANWPSKKAFKKAERQRIKTEKKQFKADVKDFKKNGFGIDYEIDAKTGQFSITEYRNSKQQKVGAEYAERIMKKAQQQNARAYLATTVGLLGAMTVAAMLGTER